MARFRYRMQSILNIKLKMETQAKQEFAMAKIALDNEEQKLQNLVERRLSYEDEARRLLYGGLHVNKIRESKEAVRCMDEYIREQEKRVQKAQELLERARVRLQEVMMERKTHEKLREKAFEEFLQEESRRESKEIDELTSYTYGQKAGEV
ncbi:MAG: flagellar export protein FliJ [Lachnospiraceae bacterium]|nr:flagellar export protein FliJ [Lachnospiraceae bacterium]